MRVLEKGIDPSRLQHVFQKGLSEDFNVSSPSEIIENCDIDVTAKMDYRTMRTPSE